MFIKSPSMHISPTYLFIWKKWTFVCLCVVSWSIFERKNSPQITHANHMTMTTSGSFSHGLITVMQKIKWT